jgi:hypothetical protein
MTDLKTPLALLLQLIVIALLGVLVWQLLDRGTPLTGPDRVAVAAADGTIYYGTVKQVTNEFLVLEDARYILRVRDQESGETSMQLLKRVQQLHAPTEMILPMSTVQFIEPVAADSEIGRKLKEG